VFFSVVTFRSVQAYDNSVSSLELICKSEFDPYQLWSKLFWIFFKIMFFSQFG